MFCKFCGREIPEKLTSAGFCPFCGKTLTEAERPAPDVSHGNEQSNRSRFITFSAYLLVFAASLGSLAAIDTSLGIVPSIVVLIVFILSVVHLIRTFSILKIGLWIVAGFLTWGIYLALQAYKAGNQAVLLVLLIAAYPTGRWISDLVARLRPSGRQRVLASSLLLSGVVIIFLISKGSGNLRFSQAESVARTSEHPEAGTPHQVVPTLPPISTQNVDNKAPTPVAHPKDSGLGTTAYEILKNPFQNSNYILTLQVEMVPQLLNGSLHGYFTLPNPDLAAASGYQALRFNRMLTPNQALFDVYGQEVDTSNEAAFEAGPSAEQLGQIVVVIMPGSLPDGARPEISDDWQVQPAGTSNGTNAFGATITVPVVRFWGYAKTPNPPTDQSAAPSPPANTSQPQTPEPQNPFSEDAAKLRSVVISRGYQPIGNTWLVTADSEGNKLLIQQAACKNVADGQCQKLFIAYNDRFLGTDAFQPSWAVHDVTQERVGSFSAVYDDLSDPNRKSPPVKVTYTWDGLKLTASGTPPTRKSEQQ